MREIPRWNTCRGCFVRPARPGEMRDEDCERGSQEVKEKPRVRPDSWDGKEPRDWDPTALEKGCSQSDFGGRRQLCPAAQGRLGSCLDVGVEKTTAMASILIEAPDDDGARTRGAEGRRRDAL